MCIRRWYGFIEKINIYLYSIFRADYFLKYLQRSLEPLMEAIDLMVEERVEMEEVVEDMMEINDEDTRKDNTEVDANRVK
jgi:hypothetical protein